MTQVTEKTNTFNDAAEIQSYLGERKMRVLKIENEDENDYKCEWDVTIDNGYLCGQLSRKEMRLYLRGLKMGLKMGVIPSWSPC